MSVSKLLADRFRTLCAMLTLVVGLPTSLAPGKDTDLYSSDVQPLLQERCIACHGALKQEAELRLDTGALIRAGGDSGGAVSSDQPDQSLLIERVTADDTDERMPPEGEALSSEQIATLRDWIAGGAKSPDNEQPQADPREHWAFQVLIRPAVPAMSTASGSASPIDSFIYQKLEQHGATSNSQAAKHTQLRRLYLDLIGLPPTREELHRFLADDSDDAWDHVVDQLLDDPRHGERWARHWMDVWRYSDWYGRRGVPDVWNSAPQVWRWRDWIVKSLNEDTGYDRMIVQMLAADEAYPDDYEAGYATGFLVRNWYALNPNDWMRANVEHTGKAFLGLTFNCAHCHDHKYDPISHEDYFRMRAFFEPLYIRQDRVPGEADPGPFQDYDYSTLRKVQHLGAVRVFDKTSDAATWFYSGGDERNREEDRGSIEPGVPALLDNESFAIKTIDLPPSAWYPGLRGELQRSMLDDARSAIAAAKLDLEKVPHNKIEVPQTAREQFAKAEADYRRESEAAQKTGVLAAIEGKQSLVLDATSGRRVLQNRLRGLKRFDDGFSIEFKLQLATDTHFNFQLARHVDKGHTASLIAFKSGNIISYRPGTSTEFEAGKYSFSAGQILFDVRLDLRPSQDQCLLTIRSVTDDAVLVDRTPVARNGWNPIDDPTKGIFLDAQTGSIAAIDDLKIGHTDPGAEDALHFGFEPTEYAEDKDVVGIEGWEPSSFGVSPATSVVATELKNAKLSRAKVQLEAAHRTVRIPELPLKAAEAKLSAEQCQLTSLESRIAADKSRYLSSTDLDSRALSRRAAQLEWEASISKLEADLLRNEHALAIAEAKPPDDPKRAKQIESSQKQFAISRDALAIKQTEKPEDQSEVYTPLSPVYPKTSTGRRRALAQWITGRDNPLTARVAINHIWTRHFHAPLVASVFDFGINGSEPTHPTLLDWLAVELVESGWSMKHIHRLIVTSDAYRRSSKSPPPESSQQTAVAEVQPDVENKLIWRMNTGRMEGEVIRDSLLYAAGLLDLKVGGQPLENSKALTTYRRSLYYEVYPEDGGASELSDLFDAPSPLECYRRTRSIVPQQALALTNSELVHHVSKTIVSDWHASSETAMDAAHDSRFVSDMFERILTRSPSDRELQLCLDGLVGQRDLRKQTTSEQASTKARESLVRSLLNHNDFVSVR